MRKRQKREAVSEANRTHLSPLPTNQTLPRARPSATTTPNPSPKRLRSLSTEFDENASHQTRKGKERAQTQPAPRQRKRKRSHALIHSLQGPSSDPNTSEDELISPNRILKRRLRSADTLHHDPGEEAEGEQSDSISSNTQPDMSDHECELSLPRRNIPPFPSRLSRTRRLENTKTHHSTFSPQRTNTTSASPRLASSSARNDSISLDSSVSPPPPAFPTPKI